MAVLIDTHLHLYRRDFDGDRDAVRGRAHATGVRAFLHVGYDLDSIEAAQASVVDPAREWASAGIHPHDAASYGEQSEKRIRELARAGRIVAIGECGLDYFRDLSPRDAQDRALRRQIALAKELDLPMIHHVRDAYPEARALLEEEGLPPRRGVFHAFAGDRDFARWAVDHGYRLGIGGVLTYPRAHLPEAIEGLPAEAFLLETDAPWLPPQPWRGRRNEPAYVRHVASMLAARLGRDLDELSAVWATSFEQTFGVRLAEQDRALQPSRCPEPEDERGRN